MPRRRREDDQPTHENFYRRPDARTGKGFQNRLVRSYVSRIVNKNFPFPKYPQLIDDGRFGVEMDGYQNIPVVSERRLRHYEKLLHYSQRPVYMSLDVWKTPQHRERRRMRLSYILDALLNKFRVKYTHIAGINIFAMMYDTPEHEAILTDRDIVDLIIYQLIEEGYYTNEELFGE